MNTLRASFTSWYDRVIAASMLLAALALAHSWLAGRSWTASAWVVLAAGIMIGVGAGRLVGTRLVFHAFDGVLAADALHLKERRQYMAAWYGVGLALLGVATLIARPSLLVVGVPAYIVGVVVARLADGLRISRHIAGTARPGWAIRAWSHRPIAGGAAATILFLSLLSARTLGTNVLMAIAGIETILLALMLTSVNDAIVRFMTIAGYGLRHIIVRHVRGLALFFAVAVPGCCGMFGPIAAGTVAAACAAILLLLTLRILAYRLHAKRFADCLVSILAGLLILVAYSMPVVLPVLALAIFWQLQRRGREKTWLLA